MTTMIGLVFLAFGAAGATAAGVLWWTRTPVPVRRMTPEELGAAVQRSLQQHGFYVAALTCGEVSVSPSCVGVWRVRAGARNGVFHSTPEACAFVADWYRDAIAQPVPIPRVSRSPWNDL